MDAVQRVKNMVRHSLIASPGVTNKELYARAHEIAPQAVEGLSLRQFHARFRLPVMVHEMGPRRKRKPKSVNRSAQVDSGSQGGAAAGAVARPRKPRRSRAGKAAEPTAALQSEVREVLVEFAVRLEKAESRSDLVRVVGGVDEVAARILRIVQGDAARAPADRKKTEPESRASANGVSASAEKTETAVTRTAA